MYKKILAPVDGSELSECALEHVKAVATGCSVPEVILLRVVEPLSSLDVAGLAEAGGDWLSKAEQLNEAEAQDYVSRLDSRMKKEGMSTKAVLVHGRAAEAIVDYASKNKVDLIIMSTHGRSGVTRWAMGSVTDKVLRHSPAPVLIVSPPGCRRS
jgi:nucleotide-binding universal stress UspA family protein